MMQLLLYSALFVIGIIFLWKGAEILVEGASKTAAELGISPLIISLTIVAYGTSAPESFVSFLAALEGYESITLGNVLGSCIANLLLVLGISALVRPLKVKKVIIKREMPIMLGVISLFMVVSIGGILNWIRGIILLVVFVLYLYLFVGLAKKEISNARENGKPKNNISKNISFILLGTMVVIVSAELLVRSSIFIGNALAIPNVILALSVVAVGTSLPELAVSSVASYKNEADISIGNLIGSNIFNIALILGVCSLVLPIHIEMISWLTTIFLLFISLVIILMLYTGSSISRREGAILLAGYCLYIFYIFSM
ncbi:MAG: calcium/sodium antiporter [Methanocellales archaeon]|nr:calcium/sodium antiporter [Methanocellales archaeon]MDD4897998.1 calcium/sodium antiporter [Methanocellales archaeon]MDD5446471.1 calcium/sodium antiporter [Methanocellales archaeon]